MILSWTEKELPQKERTKHVHGIHPYLGKFVPQIPEFFLRKYFKPGNCILDPFMGSATTLIESNVFGAESIGIDISKFNCLLAEVKMTDYDIFLLEKEIYNSLFCLKKYLTGQISLLYTHGFSPELVYPDSDYLNNWFSPKSLKELLLYKDIIEKTNYKYKNVMRVILSRSARSARLVPHYQLDWASKPVTKPYYCYKHKKICEPTDGAIEFIERYSIDVLKRIKEFSSIKTKTSYQIIHGDARYTRIDKKIDGVITSPPYCGIIDYHQQHQYAYELLNLPDLREDEIGAKVSGTSKEAQEKYIKDLSSVFSNLKPFLKKEALIILVINDSFNLLPDILKRSGFLKKRKFQRKVNRRTSSRSGFYKEDIIICQAGGGFYG